MTARKLNELHNHLASHSLRSAGKRLADVALKVISARPFLPGVEASVRDQNFGEHADSVAVVIEAERDAIPMRLALIDTRTSFRLRDVGECAAVIRDYCHALFGNGESLKWVGTDLPMVQKTASKGLYEEYCKAGSGNAGKTTIMLEHGH